MSGCLVSIIVPVYNVERYIKECIESLLNQTYKNCEIIIVDDGSTDASGMICDQYKKKYKNICVIHKKNEGLGMARNTGLKYVSGEYVMFMDSDDFLDKDAIEHLMEGIIKNHVDVCKGGFLRYNTQKGVVQKRAYEKMIYHGTEAKKRMLPRLLGSMPDKHDSLEMSVCASLYNTKIIFEHEIRFHSERELISEDMVFNIDYFQYANGACVLSDADYYYRVNNASLSQSYRADRFEKVIQFHEYICNKLGKLGYGKEAYTRLNKILFINVMMCVSQETLTQNNTSKRKRLRRIADICNNTIVQNAIRSYPVNKLPFNARVFVTLIRYKRVFALYALFNLKNRKEHK